MKRITLLTGAALLLFGSAAHRFRADVREQRASSAEVDASALQEGGPSMDAALATAPRHTRTPTSVAAAPVEATSSVGESAVDLDPQGPLGGAGGSAPRPIGEDELMQRGRGSPEQRLWRGTWADQPEDPAWSEHMRQWLRDAAADLVQGPLEVTDLSCRATVCRMYVQFADQLDAEAFMGAEGEPGLRYAYQGMDPDFDGAGFDDSDHTYELLVERPQPPGMELSQSPGSPGPAEELLTLVRERLGGQP